jgi:hypothetical protein
MLSDGSFTVTTVLPLFNRKRVFTRLSTRMPSSGERNFGGTDYLKNNLRWIKRGWNSFFAIVGLRFMLESFSSISKDGVLINSVGPSVSDF